MTTLTAPIVTTHRVQTEDGSWITISASRSTEGTKEIDIPLPGVDPSGTSGRKAKVVEQGRKKVKLYRGNQESLVPWAQIQICT